MKTCTLCQQTRPLTDYRTDPRNGKPKPRCTPCLKRLDAERFATKSRTDRDALNAKKRDEHAHLSEEQREKFTTRQSDWYASLTPEQREARNAARRRRYHAAKNAQPTTGDRHPGA